MAKMLEIRIICPDSAPDDKLDELGQCMQEQIPAEFENQDVEFSNVTYEIKPWDISMAKEHSH